MPTTPQPACVRTNSSRRRLICPQLNRLIERLWHLSVFLTSCEPSLGDLYFEAHRVGPAGVRDDELVLPVLRRRDLNQALRSGRVVLSDLRAGGVVDEKVYVSILRAVRGGLELFPRRERQEVSDLFLVLHLDLLAIERRPLAQVGRLDVLRGTHGGDREDNCQHCCD